MKKVLFSAVIATMLALGVNGADAQNYPPQQGPIPNVQLPTLITNTARGASTFNTGTQTNTYGKGVMCTYNQTAHGGSPSTTLALQGYDKASASWQTLVISGAITADTTPTSIVVYPGVQTASLVTGMVATGLHLPRQWRLQEVVSGTGTPTVTGTVGCDLLN